MPGWYIAALDQGTSSTRCILFDSTAREVCSHQIPHSSVPNLPSGHIEHYPHEILSNSKQCIDKCVEKARNKHEIDIKDIKAIGITNQRETTIVWDKITGDPLHNAIVWNDTRTKELSAHMRETHNSDDVRSRCGLPISTYFSGVKLRWLLENCPEVCEAVKNGNAMFGTVDSWLVWNFTEKKSYVTDVTNAGRTMMMNLNTLNWDDTLLSIVGIDRTMLPTICSSSEETLFGTMQSTLLKDTPITGIIGDQQAALVGQACFAEGNGKNTYGTGCFYIVNTGEKPIFSNNGLLTTPAYKLGPDEPCVYSLEGSIANAGSVVNWLRDNMGMIVNETEIEGLASDVDDTGDVYFVPAFSGLFSPRWREDARGVIVGITEYATKAHFARAALAGVTFLVNDVLQAAFKDTGRPITELRVDGGMSKNDLLMQMQANVTGSKIVRPEVQETTALGAAFCAGHAIGKFSSTTEFAALWKVDKPFSPQSTDTERAEWATKWEAAVERSLGWSGTTTLQQDESRMPSISSVVACVASAVIASFVTMTVLTQRKG